MGVHLTERWQYAAWEVVFTWRRDDDTWHEKWCSPDGEITIRGMGGGRSPDGEMTICGMGSGCSPEGEMCQCETEWRVILDEYKVTQNSSLKCFNGTPSDISASNEQSSLWNIYWKITYQWITINHNMSELFL
jgi:hypothetical protein